MHESGSATGRGWDGLIEYAPTGPRSLANPGSHLGQRQVDSITSNMAHLLWCGVPSQHEAEQVATHLASPAMASGGGLRTLSEKMRGELSVMHDGDGIKVIETPDGVRIELA